MIFNLHVDHEPYSIGRFARTPSVGSSTSRSIIGGSFFLTYHRYATREQVLACYPQFVEFLRSEAALRS